MKTPITACHLAALLATDEASYITYIQVEINITVCCVHWSREHLKLFTILSAPPPPPPLQGGDSMYKVNQLI